jgi:sugar O-acyltransferase (sialic acid O-acetyltransferase NeuD family)
MTKEKKNQPKVIMIGGGSHALVVFHILQLKEFKILGYVAPEKTSLSLHVKYLGDDQNLEKLNKHEKAHHVVAFSHYNLSSKKRFQDFIEENEKNFKLVPSLFHPTVYQGKNIHVAHGSVVCAGSIINHNTRIGSHCLINSGVIIEHDCVIGKGCHIAPGAVICGGSVIEDYSLIGAGCVVVNNTTIKSGSVVKAGQTVV